MWEVVDRNKDQSWKCEEEYHSSGRNLFFRFLIHLYFSNGISLDDWKKKKKRVNLHSKAPTWRWRVPIKSRHMFVCYHLSNHKFNVLDWIGWMPLRMVYNSIQRPEIDIAQPPTTTVLLNSPSFQPKLVGGLSTESNNTRMELHIHMMTFLHSVLM